MTYEQLKALGICIERGALAEGQQFKDIVGHSHAANHHEFLNPEASLCPPRPPGVVDDMTHLNPKYKCGTRDHATKWMNKYTKSELSAEMRRRALKRDPKNSYTRPWDKR